MYVTDRDFLRAATVFIGARIGVMAHFAPVFNPKKFTPQVRGK